MADPSTSSGQVLPSGTVTFLFTDVEGSTALWERHRDVMQAALAQHHAILRASIETNGGHVFNIVGDAFCAAFATAPAALAAALDAQRALQSTFNNQESTMPDALAIALEAPFILHPSSFRLRVRMGLHTGSAEAIGHDYRSGPTLNRVARVMSLAHGGQILLSQTMADLVRGEAMGVTLRDMGLHQLKGLADPERIFQVVAADLPSDFPPLLSLNAVSNNLPIQVTSFIGRERELSELQRLLPTTRLLTLTGSGGTGKTRLSLQVAAEVLDAYKDGVWFIDLAPLSDAALLPLTIASVLGVREEAGRPLMATLLDWLRPKALLFILDNCEHLIDACAKFADAVIHASRETRILATSREALGIAGELAWRVPSLAAPDPSEAVNIAQLGQYAAVRLFIERASFALPAFALTHTNAPAVAQICYRLDGIPLAIELAAARVKTMRVEQVAERLDDRFRLLTGGSRTALPRQQTLRSLVDWSHSLLSESERILLRRLSVFAGGWTLEAAEEVTSSKGQGASDISSSVSHLPLATSDLPRADVLDLLSRLVDKSLVVLDEQAVEPRYRLLETIRQYAREKLLDANESERLRDQHLAFFLKLAEDAEPHLNGPAQATWFARLERDYANLRLAYEWSLQESDASHAMRLASALVILWSVRGPAMEGVNWLVRAVSRPEAAAPSIVRANALFATTHLLRLEGELAQSNHYAEESLAISRAFEYRPGVARALYHLGTYARHQGDLKTSKSLLEQSLAIQEGLDSDAVVRIYVGLGWIAVAEVDYDAARKYFEQAMTVAQAAESYHSVAFAFADVGILAFLQHDYAGAEAIFEQGLNAGRAIGYKGLVSMSSRGLAYVALQRGHVERAAALCHEALLINRERRDSVALAASLAACAALAVARGQPERAARLYGSAAARLAEAKLLGNGDGRHRYPHDQAEQERYLEILRTKLDEATFNASWQAGNALTLEQAIDLALEA